jgi:predicted metal-dependent phosphoesterase TrpH
VELSRRTLVKAGGLTAALTALPAGRALAQGRERQTVTLTGVAFGTGQYQYHPFVVPPGVNRLDVAIVKQGSAATGLGIFDSRGAHYATLERPNGFRGIYGEERGEFFLATDSASDAFVPGPVEPGEWTVVVPVFQARQPTPYTITVQMSAVPAGRPFVLGRDLEVVLDEPGWYRGDLHAHTPASSDAFRSGTALTPTQWADECRRIGLDFLALTDHNVVSQNFAIADSAGHDVLLMAGEEMTNWFHGHATVSGITPGDWFDWRQLPAGALTAQADPRSGTIQEFLEAARASGAFVSAAHPFGATLTWRFFPEAAADPAARTDGIEVWTGQFQPDDEASLSAWDAMLVQGQRVVANGGSDLHGTENTQGFASGTPTTVVHADALSKRAVVAGLKAGRSFITRLPDGVELYLTATGVDGQRQIMGGTVYGAPTDVVDVEILVRRAGGMRLVVVRDGAPATVVPITSDEQVVPFSTRVGAGGYVRAEVRSAPVFLPQTPLASRTDMEAFTNPVFLVQGPVPPGTEADATRPPAQAGPRRATASPSGAGAPSLARTDDAPPAAARTDVARSLPATGGPAVLPAVGAAVAGAALLVRRMTLTELRLRAVTGDSLAGEPVVLLGQVTAARPGTLVLTRWVPGCCSGDEAVDVEVLGTEPAALPGTWWEVEGTWVEGTGAEPGTCPQVRATVLRPVAEPPLRREG